ncbi:MAG TPA: penicillin acylase family protein [Actinomycetota bacterium]
MPRLVRTTALLFVFALTVAAPPAPAQDPPVEPYRAGDRSITALNILPPGQGRYLNSAELAEAQSGGPQPPHNTDQLAMYDDMVQAAPEVTSAQLTDLFKDASFGVAPDDIEREYSPRAGVTILRDASFGVPHVYGETRSDVMFGAGYVSAEDRMFMMDVLRHAARGRLSELLGASPANLAMDVAQRKVADYTDEELLAMGERLVDLDPVAGAQFVQDGTDFTEGVNAFFEEARSDPSLLPGEYTALQIVPEDWTRADSIAIASLIGASLGVGGGAELQNAAFLAALEEGYSPAEAREIFDDLRFAEDPEAPTTTDDRFPWNNDLGPVDPSTVAIPDDPQAVLEQLRAAQPPAAVDGPFGKIRLRFPSAASNALVVGSKLSATGRPLAVFGPQTGYWSPEILMEIDLHGPGIHARGAAFPGISLYVLLGRGADYAWSATSAGSDLVDIWAVELCDPAGGAATVDSTGYMDGDDCVQLYTRTDQFLAKPSAGGLPDPTNLAILVSFTTERTDKGIVQARGTVDGTPVVFVRQRSSYGREVDSALTYVDLLDPDKVNGAADFQELFSKFTFTFNWFYVDDRDIAYQLGGLNPIRAEGVDPDLPVWDRPETDWTGYLAFEDIPKDTNPRKGFITSWNNKQAPGFRANDGNWSYGPVYRSQPLDDRILVAAEDGKVDLLELVNAMGDAATVDLRGDKVLPYMLRVIGEPEDEALAQAVDLLWAWHESGAHRRDRDGDGDYEHEAATALMEAWWSPALEAAFGPVLGEAFDDMPIGHDDHNRPDHLGSAFQNGWYGQLQKDLRSLLGDPVEGEFSHAYCGEGVLADCRQSLRDSLAATIDGLAADFGGDPAGWDFDETLEDIRFTVVGVQGQVPMQWQNRPTFQQVMEFGDLCPVRSAAPGRHVVGTSGGDVLIGGPGTQVLCGLGGNDTLRGTGGRDLLIGGGGRDRLRGGGGRDTLLAGPGTDTCRGGPDRDRLRSCERGS